MRILSITKTIDKINLAYQERNRMQEKRIRIFLTLVCILAVILIATVTIIIIQNKRLKRQRSNLDEANKRLNQHLEQALHRSVAACRSEWKIAGTQPKPDRKE